MTLRVKQGSVLGGALLIAGSCIGAGMLALPIMTGIAGFFPSIIMLIIACIFMVSTAILLVEAYQWFDRPINLLSMIETTMGKAGRAASWFLYLFLFYALIIAYLSAIGNHIHQFMNFPDWVGSVFFALLFGSLVYFGTGCVDYSNRILMLGKVISYISIIVVGFHWIDGKNLEVHNWKYIFFSFPILVISFGFHNMVPSLCAYLEGDVIRIKRAIILGAGIAFAFYFFWQLIALGSLPQTGKNSIMNFLQQDIDAAEAIGIAFSSHIFASIARLLAFFAILTSFLTQTLSLTHFFRDGFRMKKTKTESPILLLCSILPPLFFSIAYPSIFYQALGFAGGVCAVILFGVFPVAMVWIGRRKHKTKKLLGGGKFALAIIFIIALFILINQVSGMIRLPIFPTPEAYT